MINVNKSAAKLFVFVPNTPDRLGRWNARHHAFVVSCTWALRDSLNALMTTVNRSAVKFFVPCAYCTWRTGQVRCLPQPRTCSTCWVQWTPSRAKTAPRPSLYSAGDGPANGLYVRPNSFMPGLYRVWYGPDTVNPWRRTTLWGTTPLSSPDVEYLIYPILRNYSVCLPSSFHWE